MEWETSRIRLPMGTKQPVRKAGESFRKRQFEARQYSRMRVVRTRIGKRTSELAALYDGVQRRFLELQVSTAESMVLGLKQSDTDGEGT